MPDMPVDTAVHTVLDAALPEPRGPLSSAVIETLRHTPPATPLATHDLTETDPLGDDLAVALHACYELHYRGFRDVAEEWEWDPELLRFRAALENQFLHGLRSQVEGGDDVKSALDALLVEPVPGHGVTHYLRDEAEWWQLREYVAQRSLYHLKEADPQVWVIPRLQGRAKAAVVTVEFDEYGGGRADRIHAQLFADMMTAMGLRPDYLAYQDGVPAAPIALVNLMSLFGLHRRWRGALVGQFAVVEITSPPGSERLVQALQRFGASDATTLFYAEHIEADAVHEQLLRRDVIGDLLEREPQLTGDVVFGMQATALLENKLAEQVMSAWHRGETSLRNPLSSDHPGPA